MRGSSVVYVGLVVALAGLLVILKPVGPPLVVAGLLVAALGLVLPAPESRVSTPRTRLDEITPAWQFRERHSMVIPASPARVFDAVKQVRADEILLFRTLTWIRRGGRRLPESILNAGDSVPILDVATRTGFARLAEDAPLEIVIGTVVVRPRGARSVRPAEAFRTPMPPGYALAAMNFLVEPDASGGSRISTETRVYANSDRARRRFAMYWRVIYPGSALIRRMWLRAIARRAEDKRSVAEAK